MGVGLYTLAILSVTYASSLANGVEHCASREFSDYSGTVRTDLRCPYWLFVGSWRPGQEVRMELAHIDGDPFQLFLVSVQLGNSLIGQMTSSSNQSTVTCRGTSVQHSDLSDKTFVDFSWTAPSDLSVDALTVRTSVGTNRTFWKDCELFLWERNSDTGIEEATTTPASGTTTLRLAPPDVGNGRRSTTDSGLTTTNDIRSGQGLKHLTISRVACREAGNLYSIVPGSNCRMFTQSTTSPFAASYTHTCPRGTRFSPQNCSCSFMPAGECPN
ncbi:uncharacterized protein [Watersipora subatra]|uniref:uncharacterized protein n=1 Tax=Watersipora subatra TaxID=2589382 RepID=UPI00355C161E